MKVDTTTDATRVPLDEVVGHVAAAIDEVVLTATYS